AARASTRPALICSALIGIHSLPRLHMLCASPEHATPPRLAHKLAIAHLHVAAHRHHRGPAFDSPSLKTVVVIIGVLVRSRNRAAVIGIVDHDIGIRADGDRSLARIEPKQFCRAGAQRVYKAMKVEPATLHAVRVHQIHAILDPWYSIGNLRERL